MNIVITEDDPDLANSFSEYFSRELRANVHILKDPKQVFLYSSLNNPDIILLDNSLKTTKTVFSVLSELKKDAITRKIPVIVLSDITHSDLITQFIRLGAKSYLIKPPDMEELAKRIKQLYAETHPALEPEEEELDPLKKANQVLSKMLVSEELQMAALPQVALEVHKMTSNTDKADIHKIAKRVQEDVVISAKVLKAANSSYYASSSKITSIQQALSRIGMKEIKILIQVIAGRQLFQTSEPKLSQLMQDVWEHSLCCALANQIIANKANLPNPENLFLIGLTHDIGIVLLLTLIARAIQRDNKLKLIFSDEIIKTLIDSMHHHLGETMMKKWRYSESYIRVARDHDSDIEKACETPEGTATYFSNLLTRKLKKSLQPFDESDKNLELAAEKLGLSSEQITEIESELSEEFEKIMEQFDG